MTAFSTSTLSTTGDAPWRHAAHGIKAAPKHTAPSHQEGYWQTWLDYLLAKRREDFCSPYEIATIAAQLDRKREAHSWLQCALDERDSWIVYLNVDPKLKNVRREAGVRELIGKLRLP